MGDETRRPWGERPLAGPAAVPIPEPDVDSFEAFAHREQEPLFALAWSLTGSSVVAQDVVQDALTAAWKAWNRISGYDKPGAWARMEVINRAKDRHRRAGRERRALLRLAGRRSAEVAIELPQTDHELWSAVRALPDRQAEVIVLHYVEGLPVAEIADVLDCAPGTVKAHLHRARAALARLLGPDRSDDLDGKEVR